MNKFLHPAIRSYLTLAQLMVKVLIGTANQLEFKWCVDRQLWYSGGGYAARVHCINMGWWAYTLNAVWSSQSILNRSLLRI